MDHTIAASPRTFPLGVYVLTALLVLTSMCGMYWIHREEGDAFGELPDSERAALYARTMTTLRSTCAQATSGDLWDYCRSQAAFVARFPECDGDCRSLCRHFDPRPTK